MIQAYKLSILYYLLFSILLLTSGALLFEEKLGLSIESIGEYYLGDESSYKAAKTTTGILKSALPHFLGFGIFAMVLLHFLIFSKEKKKKRTRIVVYLVFLSAFFEICSPFLIVYLGEFFAYVKIGSYVLFNALILYVIWLLFKSIQYD